MEREKKLRIVIIVLAVLLAISLLTLSGTLAYKKFVSDASATVVVPDNLITPDEEDKPEISESTGSPPSEAGGSQTADGSGTKMPSGSANGTSAAAAPAQSTEAQKAATLELYKKQPEENTAFSVSNMFPGDSETKYFRVRISYHDHVTVHFRAVVRPGYEKLAEVMKVRVKLLSSDETMYEGLMRDMPASLVQLTSPGKSANDELYYEINAYLDTSVGNDYQNKRLIADFNWWIEKDEVKNLDSPRTGDASDILLWAVAAACACGILILLLMVRRRKEDEDNA